MVAPWEPTLVITIEEDERLKDGRYVITIDDVKTQYEGLYVITIEDEEPEEEPEEIDIDIEVIAGTHETLRGNPLTVYLPFGNYVLTPTGGGMLDRMDSPESWTWHVETSVGIIGGQFSLLANPVPPGPPFNSPGWAETREEAWDSVEGQEIRFLWPGGYFSFSLPGDIETGGAQNTGSLYLNIKSFG